MTHLSAVELAQAIRLGELSAIEVVEAHGNPSFLSPEGETFRWDTESALIAEQTPTGGFGVPDPARLSAEVEAYAEVGLFGDGGPPDIDERVDVELIAGVYDDSGDVIWPG